MGPTDLSAMAEEAPRALSAAPASKGGSSILLATGLAAGALIVGAVGTWVLSRRREPEVEARTRDRLRKPLPRHQPPSAADIRVR